jgi:D-arginine dehydrogenase
MKAGNNMKSSSRIVIVGAGILGSAVAYELARRGETDIVVLEAEAEFDAHSTGRSAAYFIPMYESQSFAALSKASIGFLENPPEGFSEDVLFRRDGALIAAGIGFGEQITEEVATARKLGLPVELLDRNGIKEWVPAVNAELFESAAYYPTAGEIDVAALVRAYRTNAQALGVTFVRGCRFLGTQVTQGRITRALTSQGDIVCENVVDAAGAWAAQVAGQAGGRALQSLVLRRHLLQAPVSGLPADARWPFFRCQSLALYFKLTDGVLSFSPMDADPSPVGDCVIDAPRVAATLATLSKLTNFKIGAADIRAVAGHRVFGSDHGPLIGEDPQQKGLYWAAGMGGCGIMAAPAVGEMISAALLNTPSAIDPAPSRIARFQP